MTEPKVYDGFTNWAEVQNDYQMNEPEPEEVLAAIYDGGGYEGSSLVIYRNGDKFYFEKGAHCSCYGLEDQWGPVEYPDRATFAKCFSAMEFYDDEMKKAQERILSLLETK